MSKPFDLAGQIFGNWTVLDLASKRGADNGYYWRCLCSCGVEKNVSSALLRKGVSTSCGKHPKGKPRNDLTGQRFSRLIVISLVSSERAPYYWYCKCDCGNNVNVLGELLRSGGVKSCGCLRRELLRTHGYSQFWEFGCWLAIIDRCCNQNSKSYTNYGGRGITICDRWIDSFENFYNDMGSRPSSEYSIERKDNNGNYEPENCKWATRSEQQRNKRPYSEWNFKS